MTAAGYRMGKKKGGVFITVRDSDKPEIADTAARFYKLGFTPLRHQGDGPRPCAGAGIPVETVKNS